MYALKRIELWLVLAMLIGGCARPGKAGRDVDPHSADSGQWEKTVGNYWYSLQCLPEPTPGKGRHREETGKAGREHYRLDIGPRDGGQEGMGAAMQRYLGFEAYLDFHLVIEGLGAKPVEYWYESDHGIRPYASVFLTFLNELGSPNRELVFRNRLDHNQTISFPLGSEAFSASTHIHN